jgi:hypothetical protein
MSFVKYGDPNVFDAECYMARYPDLEAYLDKHWAYYGQAEGRIPGTDADPYTYNAQAYLHRYPDLAVYLQEHWSEYGQREGRIPGCDPAPSTGSGTEEVYNDTTQDPQPQPTASDNKTLLWLAIGGGLLWYANKKKLFK